MLSPLTTLFSLLFMSSPISLCFSLLAFYVFPYFSFFSIPGSLSLSLFSLSLFPYFSLLLSPFFSIPGSLSLSLFSQVSFSFSFLSKSLFLSLFSLSLSVCLSFFLFFYIPYSFFPLSLIFFSLSLPTFTLNFFFAWIELNESVSDKHLLLINARVTFYDQSKYDWVKVYSQTMVIFFVSNCKRVLCSNLVYILISQQD